MLTGDRLRIDLRIELAADQSSVAGCAAPSAPTAGHVRKPSSRWSPPKCRSQPIATAGPGGGEKRGCAARAAFVVAPLALATSAVASGLVFSGASRVQKPREVGISDSGQLYTDRRTNPIHVE